jgi:Protein of unknown function (DUF2752)
MSWIDWFEHHQLKCPIKELIGQDCPGCGMQRSFIALMRGDLWMSLNMYPALIPVLFLLIFLILHLIYKFNHGAKILQYTYITVIALSFGNWLLKLIFC